MVTGIWEIQKKKKTACQKTAKFAQAAAVSFNSSCVVVSFHNLK